MRANNLLNNCNLLSLGECITVIIYINCEIGFMSVSYITLSENKKGVFGSYKHFFQLVLDS